jgi:hypothetical protein
MYEKKRELAQITLEHWTSKEVFSYQWFIIVGVLIVVYAIWLKLVDRKRGTELLLIGSLMAIAKILVTPILLDTVLGLYHTNVTLLPLPADVLTTSVTLSPILIMLVTQYTTNLERLYIMGCYRVCIYNFVILPIYLAIGILEFSKRLECLLSLPGTKCSCHMRQG